MAFLDRLPAPVAGIVLAAAAGPALAAVNIPVDDFEVADFDLQLVGAGGPISELVDIPYPPQGHCIAPRRFVTCQSTWPQGVTRASLDAGSQLNDAMSVSVAPNSAVSVNYDWGYLADLTVGGQVDRIEMDVAGTIGDEIALGIYGDGVIGPIVRRAITSTGPVVFDLSDYGPGIDVTRIEGLTFNFTDAGAYLVSEIRLRGDSSGPVDFDIRAEATQTPPLPSPPIEFDVLDALVAEPVFTVDFGILHADAGFTPALDLNLGVVEGLAGQVAGLTMSWVDLAPFADGQLTLSVDVENESGLFVDLYPPDPVHGPEGILLTFPTVLRSGPGGEALGRSETWLTIDPGAMQGLEFGDVSVGQSPGRDWAGGFTVTFDVYGTTGVETIYPLLDLTWWSDYATNVPTGAPVLGAAGDAALRVVPSVTQDGARVEWANPLSRATRLSFFDIQGRRVAALPVAAGMRSVAWDGRGRDGRPLPAGVYFVRAEGGAASGAARVVKLR